MTTPDALARLSTLPDDGLDLDPEAARVALPMLRYGPRRYGTEWSAAPNQVERRLAAAAARQSTFVAGGSK